MVHRKLVGNEFGWLILLELTSKEWPRREELVIWAQEKRREKQAELKTLIGKTYDTPHKKIVFFLSIFDKGTTREQVQKNEVRHCDERNFGIKKKKKCY